MNSVAYDNFVYGKLQYTSYSTWISFPGQAIKINQAVHILAWQRPFLNILCLTCTFHSDVLVNVRKEEQQSHDHNF